MDKKPKLVSHTSQSHFFSLLFPDTKPLGFAKNPALLAKKPSVFADNSIVKSREPNKTKKLEPIAFENKVFAVGLRRRFGIVRVAPSSIPGAGLGVFAVTDLPPKRILEYYCGEELTEKELNAKYAKNQLAPYVLRYLNESGEPVFVDAADASKSNWTRFINDVLNSGAEANVRFGKGGRVVTTRAIVAGEELLAFYGKDYWAVDF